MLVLEVVSSHAAAMGANARRVITDSESSAFKIGREPDNHWVLPQENVSRHQAVIRRVNGRYLLEYTGKSPLAINDAKRRLKHHKVVPLSLGDRLFFDDIEVRVAQTDANISGGEAVVDPPDKRGAARTRARIARPAVERAAAQANGHPPVPAPAAAPPPPPPVSEGRGPDRPEAAGRVPEYLLSRVEQQLVKIVGPFASVLVRRAAASAGDLRQLIEILGTKLSAQERERFNKSVANVPDAPGPPGPKPAPDMERPRVPRPVVEEPPAPLAEKRRHSVFISHASSDEQIADAICATLERNGTSCWIAHRDVMPGEQFAEAIIRAINETRVMVVVVSEHANASAFLPREVERACAYKRPIITFRIDAVQLTAALEFYLMQSQWLDARVSGIEQSLPRLVDAVRRNVASVCGGAPAPDAKTAGS